MALDIEEDMQEEDFGEANDETEEDIDNHDGDTVGGHQTEEKVSPSPLPLRLRPSIPSSTFCFVCVNDLQLEKEKMPPVSQSDCFHLLTAILELTGTESDHYLHKLGEPDKWIGLCFKCHDLLREAAKVRVQIAKLQSKLGNCQRQIVEKMRMTKLATTKTRRGTQQKPCPKREQRIAVESILEIVHARNYSAVPSSRKRGHQSADLDDDKQKPQTGPSTTKKCKPGHANTSSLSKSISELRPSPSISLPHSTVGSQSAVFSEEDHEDEERIDTDPLSCFEEPDIKTEVVKDNDDGRELETSIRISQRRFSLKLTRLQLPPKPPPTKTPKTDELIHYYPCDLCSRRDNPVIIYSTKEELELHKQTMHQTTTTIRIKRRRPSTPNKRKEAVPSSSSSDSEEAACYDDGGSDPDFNEEISNDEGGEDTSAVGRRRRNKKVVRRRPHPSQSVSEEAEESQDFDEEEGDEDIRKIRHGRRSRNQRSSKSAVEHGGVKVKGYDCPTCPLVKNYDVNRFAQHLAIHQRNPFKCSACSALLPDNQALQEEHWKDKHSNPNVSNANMEPPGATSTTGHASEKFIKVPLDPGEIWKCDGCPSGFLSEEARALHEKSCPDFSSFSSSSSKSNCSSSHSCSTCSSIFRSIEEWRLHRVLNHPEIDRLSCLYCDQSFGALSREGEEHRHDSKMRTHIIHQHKSFSAHIVVFNECRPCALVFQNKKETIDHFRNIHQVPPGGRIFFCHICPKSFLCKISLSKHIREIHFRGMPGFRKSRDKAKFPCDRCGEGFLESRMLHEHRLLQHGILPPEEIKLLTCPVGGCGFQSTFKRGLHSHSEKVHDIILVRGSLHVPTPTLAGRRRLARIATTGTKVSFHKLTPSTCDLCGVSLSSLQNLCEHQLRKHGLQPPQEYSRYLLPCLEEGCLYQTFVQRSLLGHSSTKHGAPRPRRFTCKYCGKGLIRRKDLTQHEFRHENKDSRPFQCETCGKSFTSQKNLDWHRRTIHEGKLPPSAYIRKGRRTGRAYQEKISSLPATEPAHDSHQNYILDAITGSATCKQCPLTFSSVQSFSNHYEKIHLKLRFKCVVCSKMYADRSPCYFHVRKFHPDVEGKKVEVVTPEDGGGGPALLEKAEPTQYRRRRRKPERDIPPPLKIPGKGGDWAGQFQTIPASGRVKCLSCLKDYSALPTFITHYKSVHLGERLKCPECEELFPLVGRPHYYYLRHYRKMHQGLVEARPKCDQCGKTFSEEGPLKAHLKYAHLGERFVCEQCGRAFTTEQYMRTHIKAVHSHLEEREQFFGCERCGEGFKRKSDLKIHQRKVHHNGPDEEKPEIDASQNEENIS